MLAQLHNYEAHNNSIPQFDFQHDELQREELNYSLSYDLHEVYTASDHDDD